MRINRIDITYFFILLSGLLTVYWPFFSYPLLSDCWEMFYSFHHLDAFSGPIKWLHVLNLDAFEKMRYQPLSHLIYYVIHSFCGADYIYFNIINFLLYFLNLILLYRLALYFTHKRSVIIVFITLFAFLFNQCGILIWSLHIYILFGLTMFLSGFINYISYLKTCKRLFLVFAAACFLMGMWCYEPFLFWPFAIIILSRIRGLRKDGLRVGWSNWAILLAVYFVYLVFYIFTRFIGTYPNPTFNLADFLKPENLLLAGFIALFNTLYNGFIGNIVPFIAFPLKVTENAYMAGPLINYLERGHVYAVYVGGLLILVALTAFYFYLGKKKLFEEMKVISFFLFLAFSELYILFFCRLVTNSFGYGLTEFRYQYISNGIIISLAIYGVNRFLVTSGLRKRVLISCAVLVLVLNIYCVSKVLELNNRQLVGLKTLIHNIKSGIKDGKIDKSHRLYLDDDLPDYLPSLCWNIEMGKMFIVGNFQWMFSKKEIAFFSEDLENAAWVIDKDNLEVIAKKMLRQPLIRKRLNEGKDEQYLNCGYYYNRQNKSAQAEAMFKKALELNPDNLKAYINLGHLYNWQHNYIAAEAMFQKAMFLKPLNCEALNGLGACYIDQGRWLDAETILNKSLQLNPRSAKVYINFGHLYNGQGKSREAEAMFKKALDIEPGNIDAKAYFNELIRRGRL